MNNSNTDKPAVQWGNIVSAVAVAVVAALGFWRLRYGISFTDEGVYLSVPLRYTHGDLPFRDELMNWCMTLLWPVMKLFPDAGVIALRQAWWVAHLGCAGALYASVRKWIPLPVLGACFCAAMCANVFSIWTPGYHVIESDLVCLFLALWIWGIESTHLTRAAALGAAAGAAYVGAQLNYAFFPLLPLVAIPAGFLVYFAKRDGLRSAGVASCAGYLAATVLLWGVAASAMQAMNLWPDFSFAYHEMMLSIRQTKTFGLNLAVLSKWAGFPKNYVVFHLLTWGAAWAVAAKRDSLSVGARKLADAAVAALAVGYGIVMTKFALAAIVSGLCCAALFAYPFARPRGPEKIACAVLFFIGAPWFFLVSNTSSASFTGASYTAPALFLLFAFVAMSLFKTTSGARFVQMLFLALAVNVVGSSFTHVYGDDTLRKLDGTFSWGRLEGVKSSKERVADVEALLGYLQTRVKPGDRLLAYHDIPILYYLTGTLPALDLTWTSQQHPLSMDVHRRSVENMVRRGRTPRYAVRLMLRPDNVGRPSLNLPLSTGDWPRALFAPNTTQAAIDPVRRTFSKDDPIDSFVMKNYKSAAVIGPFEVWELKRSVN